MTKKGKFFMFLAVLFLLIFSKANEAADVIEARLDEVAKVFETYFPKAESRVTSVDGSGIGINIGRNKGLLPGMILSVTREGEEIFHPVTKEPLGRHEDEIGYIELKAVEQESSTGILAGGKKDNVKSGDKARLTSGKIKAAVVPAAPETNIFIIDQFADALEETGRFTIVSGSDVDKILKEHPNEGKEEIARRVGDAFKVSNILFVKTSPSKDKTLFTAELISLPNNSSIANLTAILRVPSKGPLPMEDDPQFKAFVIKKKEFWKKEEIPFGVRWVSVGDLDGDGKNEIVVSNGNKIRVYRYADGKFVLIWEEKDAKRAYNQLYIDVADINKDGKAEIFITNLIKDRLYSYVIEWRDGEFKKIQKDMKYFLKVQTMASGDSILLCQEIGNKTPFYGNVKRCEWDGAKYKEGERFPLPKGVNIYGFTIADLDGNGDEEIIAIDDTEHIRIYSMDGKQVLRSPDRYGGYGTSFDFDFVDDISGAREKKATIKGRIFAKDIDGDGRLELILSKNVASTYAFEVFRGYLYGEMYVFHWNGVALNEMWKIKRVSGFIDDFTIADLTNEGFERLILATSPILSTSKIEELFKTKSDFIIYNLPERG